jgi:ATP-dependent helicase Lhr and Lhr-like helicase
MMPTENSSTAFSMLDEKIQRWIWEHNWTDLRDIQETSIPIILAGDKDIIIASSTASGKTEAAFLPICSKLLETKSTLSTIIYISPLKALINDQFSRVKELCEHLDIPVHPWHGDVSDSKKKDFLKESKGILLITPESLEAIFVNHGSQVSTIFNNVTYIVVDELHSFIGGERGSQLRSLLHRIELVTKKHIPRIGLSATLGDMGLAAEFLRSGQGNNVNLIVSSSTGQDVKLLVRGFIETVPDLVLESNESTDAEVLAETDTDYRLAISKSLFKTLRGTSNLIFANSRAEVENYADMLRRLSEKNLLPNEFWPHHGSLSKELREYAEEAIKDKSKPVNIVCTSTLEMGIDIGAVNSIAQIGVPPSVASMRQRLGRSGRRGDPAILRIYLKENEISNNAELSDELRPQTVQTIAMVHLLVSKWYEPPSARGLHFSTLIQQILSIIAQHGGVTALQAWKVLCCNGPFQFVNEKLFIDLLRDMGAKKLLMQTTDGLLLLGEVGERIVNHFTFYAAFMTNEEYRLVTGSETLGTLPIDRPVPIDSFLIFGGRRWQVVNVDVNKKVIELKHAKAGKAPSFGGKMGWVHDRIRQEMLSVYTATDIPVFLDVTAKQLLLEARENFLRYKLAEKRLISKGNNCYLFCWVGDQKLETIAALIRREGFNAWNDEIYLTIETREEELKECLKSICSKDAVDPLELAKSIPNKASEKYDPFLSEELMSIDYAAAKLDVPGALQALQTILSKI